LPPGTRPSLGRFGPRQLGRDRFGLLGQAGLRDPPTDVPPAVDFSDPMATSHASSSRTRRVSSSSSTSPCPDAAPAVLAPTAKTLTEAGPLAEVSGVSVPLVGEAAAVGSSPDGHPPGGVIDPGGTPPAIQMRNHCCKTSLDCPSRAMALSWSCHRSMKQRARSVEPFRLVIHFSFPDAILLAQTVLGFCRPSHHFATHHSW
jgi:hypothetical protein